MWCVVNLVLLAAVTVIGTFTGPENILNVKDATDTELTCGMTAQAGLSDKAWFKTSEADTQIANDAGLISGMETDYEISSNTDNWNLKIIKALAVDDGDKYICKQDTNTGTARVIVVETPSCTLADEGSNQVKFTCSASYGGDWPPRATMKDHSDTAIGTAVTGSGGTLTKEEDITVTSANNGNNFKCEMAFDITDNPSNGDSGVAQNVPVTSDAKYKCSSVAAKPASVTIAPAGENFVNGDTLTCTATGNPEAKIQWSDGTNDLSSVNGVLTLTTDMAGETLTCTASNNIGTETATRSVATVEAAPSTIPPTVPGGNDDSTVTQTDTYTSPENSATCPEFHSLVIAITLLSAFLIYRG